MLQISSIASNTGPLIFSWQNENKLHCNPLQGNYRVELLHRELPVVITGNEFTKYNRENPQNSEPQNGPRRGRDFIALKPTESFQIY